MPEPENHRSFPTTRWTLVVNAGARSTEAAHAALAQLCQGYWYPLYAFIRQRGYSAHDAQDLTQSFFTHLLAGQAFVGVSPEKGRFRTFLLASLKHFLTNEWEKARAEKRGGSHVFLSLDRDEAEARFFGEPAHDWTPEKLFERRWALTLLDQVLSTLQREYHAEGKADLFEALKGVLIGGTESYAVLAARLGRSEGAVKVAAHRLRRRYREVLRGVIGETVADGEVDEELRHLLSVLGG